MKFESYQDVIIDEFDRRQMVNSAYSLRAYARDLGISAPSLSQLLKKKGGISVDRAQEIAARLKLKPELSKWFCLSAGALHARNAKDRESSERELLNYSSAANKFELIKDEYFQVISDWYHFAILELTYLEDFDSQPEAIGKRLGITANEASTAIERMEKLGLLKREGDKFIDTFKFLATPSDVPSASLRKFHAQLMRLGMEALHNQDVLEREISSNIFAVDREQIPVLKEKIRVFRRELEQEASRAKKKDAVYCLGMQLHQLTKNDPETVS